MSLDRYEHYRPPRKDMANLIVARRQRHDILAEDWQIPRSDIANAVRQNLKCKNQRRRTVNNLKTEKMDEVLESARRKLRRTLLFQRRPSKQVDNMMKKANQAAAFMAQLVRQSDGTTDLFGEFDPAEEEDEPMPTSFLHLRQDSTSIFKHVVNQAAWKFGKWSSQRAAHSSRNEMYKEEQVNQSREI